MLRLAKRIGVGEAGVEGGGTVGIRELASELGSELTATSTIKIKQSNNKFTVRIFKISLRLRKLVVIMIL